MICIVDVNISCFYAEFNEIFYGKLASHLQGPGEQVDQGLGGEHHDPQRYFFLLFFFSWHMKGMLL